MGWSAGSSSWLPYLVSLVAAAASGDESSLALPVAGSLPGRCTLSYWCRRLRAVNEHTASRYRTRARTSGVDRSGLQLELLLVASALQAARSAFAPRAKYAASGP